MTWRQAASVWSCLRQESEMDEKVHEEVQRKTDKEKKWFGNRLLCSP